MDNKYICYKSAAKTAKENNIIKTDVKRLFDLSILDQLQIDNGYKDYIIQQSIKDITLSINDYTFIYKDIDSYDSFTIEIYFKRYHVEDDYKRLYTIFKAVKINYVYKKRDPWHGTEAITDRAEIKIGYDYYPETIIINEV